MPESTASIPAGQRTLSQIEWLRCVACILVVTAHCDTRWIEIGALAVILFLTISIEFASRTPRGGVIGGRVRKTLVLWLAWSAIYAIVVVARSLSRTGSPFSGFAPWMIATGPSIHLWYLPALALVLGATLWAFGGTGGTRRRTAGIGGVLLVPIAMAATSTVGHPIPVPQLAAAVFAFACAMAIGSVVPAHLPRRAAVVGWMLLLLAPCVVLALESPWIGRALASAGAILLCRAEQAAPSRMIRWAAGLTAGVYLIHMAVALAVEFAFGLTLAWTPAVLAASALLVAAIRRTPLRWLTP